MDISEIAERAADFAQVMEQKRTVSKTDSFEWYPWSILPANVQVLDRLLSGPNRELLALAGGGPIADIGAADGDLAFFLESLGQDVDIIDHAVTDETGLMAAAALKQALESSVEIFDIDLDTHFELPRRYGLAFFTGILYHLRNPYYALETLARQADFCILSTKTATYGGRERLFGFERPIRIANMPVAFLLDERELNNDPTNYWVFSHEGLRLLLRRTGWEVLDYFCAGRAGRAYANSADEEREWYLLRSTVSP